MCTCTAPFIPPTFVCFFPSCVLLRVCTIVSVCERVNNLFFFFFPPSLHENHLLPYLLDRRHIFVLCSVSPMGGETLNCTSLQNTGRGEDGERANDCKHGSRRFKKKKKMNANDACEDYAVFFHRPAQEGTNQWSSC